MTNHLVFVYGTLRRGSAHSMSNRFPESKFITQASARGRLYDLGPYPGLVVDGSSSLVAGEVYEVDDETLKQIDGFEASSNYRRREVELSPAVLNRTCWTYEPDPEFYSFQVLILSGDWIEYAKRLCRKGPGDSR